MAEPQSTSLAQSGQGQQAFPVALPDQLTWGLEEAAAMCGISVSAYRDWRRKGVLPEPIPGTSRYSADAVRRALSMLPNGVLETHSPYEKWKAGRD